MDGYIYFIQKGEDGPVKIGWTSRGAVTRLREWFCQEPDTPWKFRGKLPGDQAREKRIHDLFKKDMILPENLPEGMKPIDKTELFRPSESLMGYVGRLRDKSLS